MERILKWKVPDEREGMKLEEFLRSKNCSHHVLTHLKRTDNGILCNGSPAFSSQRLEAGDLVQIRILEEEASENITPVCLPLTIVYEDEDLMIINKSSDTPIHPSVNNHCNTLANGVAYYFSSRNIPFVFRCINRLDRDTSGLLIIAKNMMSGSILSRMSANRQIHREYLAIVEGSLPECGTIDSPIARMEGSALMRCVDQKRGEPAITHYHRLQFLENKENITSDLHRSRGLSLASVCLETGRTHQIRVHMKSIGHPLIGDFLYNPASDQLIGRQALHSHRLTFSHPITGELLDFVCELPDDMQKVLLKRSSEG